MHMQTHILHNFMWLFYFGHDASSRKMELLNLIFMIQKYLFKNALLKLNHNLY